MQDIILRSSCISFPKCTIGMALQIDFCLPPILDLWEDVGPVEDPSADNEQASFHPYFGIAPIVFLQTWNLKH